MPSSVQVTVGRMGENAWNSRLAQALKSQGFPSAEFEKLFPTLRGIRKPDVTLDGGRGLVVISAKLGERQEVDAIITAQEYQQTISKVGNVQEALAVTYPSKSGEVFRLRALATLEHDSLPWACKSLEEVVEKIVHLARQDWAKAQLGLESSVTAAIRVLRAGVTEYSSKLIRVPLDAVETVFGGGQFFDSILGYEKAQKNRSQLLRAAAYLFLNQVMFYEILARETGNYPLISEQDYNKPTALKPKYFDLVLKKDYRPIFAFDVTGSLSDAKVGEASSKIVRAVKALFPKSPDHDIVGKIFHNLIPFEIRKLVAAYFTNTQAGDLLAGLSIYSKDDKVLDPACGSGTLLVSSYKTKAKLAGGVTEQLHRQFVEEDLTGMDIMAFSAHLAAVNLALQAPLFETDNVRIAVADSTTLSVGTEIEPAREVFKQAFKSRRLDDFVNGKLQLPSNERTTMGAVVIGADRRTSIRIQPFDLVIMNPPFTNCDNLPRMYKDELVRRFQWPKEHAACIQGNLSFQAYFILLADRLLKENGRIACVLPLTTFSGKAFRPTIAYLLSRYTVKAIVVGIGRSAFSENTSLSEILLLATKSRPSESQQFVLLGTKKPPTEWSDQDIEELRRVVDEGVNRNTAMFVARVCPQTDLNFEGRGLMALASELNPSVRTVNKLIEPLLASDKATMLGELLSDINTELFMYEIGNPDKLSKEYGKGSKYFGFSALFIINSLNRMKKKSDYLLLQQIDDHRLVAQNRYDKSVWEIPRAVVMPCIRRLTGVSRLAFAESQDYAISRFYKGLPRIVRSIYSRDEAEFFEGRIKEEWQSKVSHGVSNVCLARRINIGAKGTNLLAVYNENPMLLVANSWGFRNLRREYAKALTLWFNSTLFLLSLLANRMQTEGTFGQVDRRQLASMKCPSLSKFKDDEMDRLVRLFDQLKQNEFVSIVEQLESGFEPRKTIDDAFMQILGVENQVDRERIGASIRKAAQRNSRSSKNDVY